MTAAEPLGVPGLPPVRLLTAAEYAKLGESGWGYTELMEGRILVAPSPTAKHNMAGLALAMQLVPQLPVAPGSHRLDNVTKRGEYADAGIPRYWIVDLDEPVSLLNCHLAEDFGYADSGAITGVLTLSAPFSVRLALDLPI